VIRTPLASAAAVVAAVALVAAQGSGNARFRYERSIDISTPGPQRLDLDAAVVAGTQPFGVTPRGLRSIAVGGLADLRLFSAANVEVPYLVVPPNDDAPAFVEGRVLPVASTDKPDEKASGFELDLGLIRQVDALSLGAVRGPFLKRFMIEGSGDRERWTQLVVEGTAFNLPAEQLAHTVIDFDAGAYRYLRVTWDDTNSARVPPPETASARIVTTSSPGQSLGLPLAIARRPSEPGRSRFRVTLPAARLPIVALELTVGGGHLSRPAWVIEAGLVGSEAQPRTIGKARLVRVIRDEVTAEELRIPINPPAEPQLDLVVDDGDNPPLALEGVTAVFAELPWIFFESVEGPMVARYGDPNLAAPRYDLEAARASIPESPPRAAWRPQPPVTLAVEPEGLPMPETGGPLSLDGFEYARDIPAGPAGLIALPLDAAVMAHSGLAPRRLRDLRVVDRGGLQVPYLLEKRDEPLLVEARIERRDLPAGVEATTGRVTSYAVRVPYQALPNSRLVLSTQARVFKRPVTLGTVMAATERQPARFARQGSTTWVHADQSIPAPSLTLTLPDSINGDLFLLVEEGDNQPLPIEKATILLPSYAVRLFRRPDLPLRLVYGKDDIEAPRYDLQLLAPQLMGRLAEDVAPGPEQRLSAGTAAGAAQLVSPVVFWAALALAVIVLLGLVVRLMRREAI
jgi:hypothetical protein